MHRDWRPDSSIDRSPGIEAARSYLLHPRRDRLVSLGRTATRVAVITGFSAILAWIFLVLSVLVWW